MAKRRMGIMAVLLCICLCWMPCQAQAASTTDAVEPILPEKTCTLTICYGYDGTVFADLPVKLYRIAEVSADFQYALTPAFAASGLILNGIQTVGEWNVIRTTLEAHILAYGVEADVTAVTDAEGTLHLENLATGLYLAVAGLAEEGTLRCEFDSALIALPGLDPNGSWQYQVMVEPKAQVTPPVDPDAEIFFKVLKLWKGDEGKTDRPQSIEVEIFRDGIYYQTVTLSEENHWSYSWSAKDDGATWMVVERNVPEGYTMTLEERGTAFVVTNTYDSDTPSDPPITGDTGRVMLYMLLLYGSGTILLLFGMIRKRKRA